MENNINPCESVSAFYIDNPNNETCEICKETPYCLEFFFTKYKKDKKNKKSIAKICEKCALTITTKYATHTKSIDMQLIEKYIEADKISDYTITIHEEKITTETKCDQCDKPAVYTHRVTTSQGSDDLSLYSFYSLCPQHIAKHKGIIKNTINIVNMHIEYFRKEQKKDTQK